MNGVQTRFKCKLDVKRCKRFVFPPSSLLPRSNALKTKAIRYFQTDRTLTRIVSPPLKERLNIVYSTNPDYNYEMNDDEEQATLPPAQQRLRVQLDRKNRGGKVVTLVTGFVGTDNNLKELGKLLKSKCGVGGSAKDGEIIVQGDFKQRVIDLLKAEGYTQTKPVG